MADKYRIEGREPTIFRVIKNKDNPYVMIDRRIVDNREISYKAKGILTYLLSRPDGWEVNVPDLVNHSTEGPAAIRTGLKELRIAGYIHYNTLRVGGHINKWVIEVYELPHHAVVSLMDVNDQSLDAEFQLVENLLVENLLVENRGELNKELSNNESSINSTTRDPEIKDIFRSYESEIGPLTSTIRDAINSWIDDPGIPNQYIIDAMEQASLNNKRSWAYTEAILKRWKVEGKKAKASPPTGPKVPKAVPDLTQSVIDTVSRRMRDGRSSSRDN